MKLKIKNNINLHPKGKIYCLRDLDCNVLTFKIELEGWISTSTPVTSRMLSYLRYSTSDSPFFSCLEREKENAQS